MTAIAALSLTPLSPAGYTFPIRGAGRVGSLSLNLENQGTVLADQPGSRLLLNFRDVLDNNGGILELTAFGASNLANRPFFFNLQAD